MMKINTKILKGHEMYIGNKCFERLPDQTSIQPRFDTLWDAYKTYSAEKMGVWYHWVGFLFALEDTNNVEIRWENMGIYTKNPSVYTICFRIRWFGINYQCLIMPTHNYIWKVQEEN